MCSVFISDKTPHTNKDEVYRYKVTARDVISTNVKVCFLYLCLIKFLNQLEIAVFLALSGCLSLHFFVFLCVHVFVILHFF